MTQRLEDWQPTRAASAGALVGTAGNSDLELRKWAYAQVAQERTAYLAAGMPLKTVKENLVDAAALTAWVKGIDA
jgi:hypothetical protein